MPTSARKSSVGTLRRLQQRAHLPFRADDLNRGKKTGLPVPIIEHESDDFEPFDEILSQADARSAWHGQKNRPGSSKKRKSVAPIPEDDDGDEMSMELDDYGASRLHVQMSGFHTEKTNARRTDSCEWKCTLCQWTSAIVFAAGRTCRVIRASRREPHRGRL